MTSKQCLLYIIQIHYHLQAQRVSHYNSASFIQHLLCAYSMLTVAKDQFTQVQYSDRKWSVLCCIGLARK